MASMFLAMARQMGYEARQVDGGVPLRRGGVNDHSWVEINVNGTWYICDPDFQQETGHNGYMLHLTYQVDLAYQKDLSANTLWLSQSVAYCMNWAVPVFLMVTGSLLLNLKKELPLEKLWKKYILRMIWALIISISVFRVADGIFDRESISYAWLGDILIQFLTNGSWTHLWYLYLMVGLYAMMPFYKKIAGYASDQENRYLLLLYLVFVSGLPLLKVIGIQAAFYLPDQLIYPFYLFFGYGFVSGKIRCKKRLAFWTLIASWLAMIFAAYLRFACGKKNLSPLLDYSSLIVVLMACSSFVLLHDLRLRETSFAARILLALDRTSFGIYLFHMVFIMIFLRGFAYNPYASPWGGVFILGLWLAISMLSYLLVTLLQKIPGLKKVF